MQGNSNQKKIEVNGKLCVHRHGNKKNRSKMNMLEKAIETKTRQQGKDEVRKYHKEG